MSQIPDTPRQPRQRKDRNAFWRGVFAGFGGILGVYAAIIVALNWTALRSWTVSDNIVRYAGTVEMHTTCREPELTVSIDGSVISVTRGSAHIMKLTSHEVGWRCGERNFPGTMTCANSADYALVSRLPQGDKMSIRCEETYGPDHSIREDDIQNVNENID